MMELKERITRILDLSGLKRKEVARQLNIQPQDVSNMAGGWTKNPKIDILMKLAKICKVDAGWLITGHGTMIKEEPIKYGANDLTLVPILGSIPAGIPLYAEEVRDGKIPYLKKDLPSDAFALNVTGDSMLPELEENDIVVCYLTRLNELKGNGEIVAVRIGTDSMIKCLYKERDKIILTAFNPKYRPMIVKLIDIDVIAKVLCKIKKYK